MIGTVEIWPSPARFVHAQVFARAASLHNAPEYSNDATNRIALPE
jgi:hypothetical protein